MKLFLSTVLLHTEIKALLDVIYAYNNIPEDFILESLYESNLNKKHDSWKNCLW